MYLRLWDFAVRLYKRNDGGLICLDWQDRCGIDVPILLHACWAGVNEKRILANDLAAIDDTVRAWRSTAIQPLRNVRRAMKGLNGKLGLPTERAEVRELVKSAELMAEKVALELLEDVNLDRVSDEPYARLPLQNILTVFQYFAHSPASGSDVDAAERLSQASFLANRDLT